ncbi:hypothetical protein KY334_01145 [Candidatus Woesearchaeota archaeon]|nr:hypothetical protein [Candidatus Woesearchaeota archaeon]
MANYKQLCYRCRRNYVPADWRNKFLTCYDCQKTELEQKVDDPKLKKMFNIPEEFYKKNAFLRSVKINYHKFGGITEKQVEAFKETVKRLKEESE